MAASTVNRVSFESSCPRVCLPATTGAGSANRGCTCGRAGSAVSEQIRMRNLARKNPLILLVSQYIQGGLQFAARVRIAGGDDPAAVVIPRVVRAIELFKRLPPVIIRGGV